MSGTRPTRTRRWLGLAAAAACLGATVGAEAPVTQSRWDDWTSLRLTTRGRAFLTGSIDLRRSVVDDTCRLETNTSARLFGARVAGSRTLSVLEAASLRPRQVEVTSDKRVRRYVFGPAGYRVDKLVPRRGRDRASGEWETTSTREFPYPTTAAGDIVPVYDYYGMLLYLGRLPLEHVGDEAVVHVATSRGPVPYRLVVADTGSAEQSVTSGRHGGKRRETVAQIRLRVLPADAAHADEGFLRMEGETELWLEARTKTLLRVNGKAPRAGQVRLMLAEID